MSDPPRFRRLAPGLALLVLTAAFLTKVYDYDVWFHMVIGREIVSRGAIPHAEFYVWPVLGEPAKFHEWGFGVLTYLAHRGLGLWGLALLNALLGAGAVALLAAAAIRRGASAAVTLGLAGPLALAITHRVQYRPEGALFLALGATAWVLERTREDRRWLVAVPVIAGALSLFHPSPLFVLFLVGCFGLDQAIARWGTPALRPDLRGLALAVAASGLAIAFVPYGIEQLTKPFAFASAQLRLAELMPVLDTTLAPAYVVLAVVACSAAAVTRRPSDAVIVVAFAALAFRHVRGVALLALVAYPTVAVALSRLLARVTTPRARALGSVVSLGACIAGLMLSPSWGAGIPAGWLPERAVSYLAGARLEGRVLNPMGIGGYLAWALPARYQVSLDGHFFARNEAHRLEDELFQLAPGMTEALGPLGVSAIATPGVFSPSGAIVPLVAALAEDEEWSLVAAEPAALLFVRGRPDRALPKREAWRHVAGAASAVLEVYGEARAPDARRSRGLALFKLRDFRGAAADLARYAALVPSDPEGPQLVALLAAYERGDPSAAAVVEALAGSDDRSPPP